LTPTEPARRQCQPCTACCDGWLTASVNGVPVRPGQPCPHSTRAGCDIYATRPEHPCKRFICGWVRADSPLPDWMRPNECGAIVLLWFDWKGEKVINAIPVGAKIPDRTLDWLKAYAQQERRPLIFMEHVESEGSYTAMRCFGFGPPAFRKKVQALRLQSEYAELIRMYARQDAAGG